MPSPYFRAYVSTLRRLRSAEAHVTRIPGDATHGETVVAHYYPPDDWASHLTHTTPDDPADGGPTLPAELPRTFADTALGRRFRGN